jgi:hypothetical protein
MALSRDVSKYNFNLYYFFESIGLKKAIFQVVLQLAKPLKINYLLLLEDDIPTASK